MISFSKSILCSMLVFTFMFNSVSVQANVGNSMFSTIDVVNTIERAEVVANLKNDLNSDEIKELLAMNGYSEKHLNSQLASLSDAELMSLQSNIQQAKAGGILVAILLVILIVYFAQRI